MLVFPNLSSARHPSPMANKSGQQAERVKEGGDWSFMRVWREHSQHQRVQISLHNHVLHAAHRLLQKVRVGRIGVVHVDFFLVITH